MPPQLQNVRVNVRTVPFQTVYCNSILVPLPCKLAVQITCLLAMIFVTPYFIGTEREHLAQIYWILFW